MPRTSKPVGTKTEETKATRPRTPKASPAAASAAVPRATKARAAKATGTGKASLPATTASAGQASVKRAPRKPAAAAPAKRATARKAAPKPIAPSALPEVASAAVLEGVQQGVADVAAAIAAPEKVVAQSEAALQPKPAAEPSADASPDPSAGPDFDALAARLMSLQQQVRAAKIPVVLVLEGWEAAGKGTVLGKLLQGLDPRGYKVHVIGKPSCEQKRYPLLTRYWQAMPAQGNLSIFLKSWYRTVSDACLEENIGKKELERRYADIQQMESQLVCDGALVLKCFLHITRKEQKKRLKALEAKRSTRWRVSGKDWAQNEQYDKLMKLYDTMMERTHREGALWHVLQGDNAKTCAAQMYELLIRAFEVALRQREQGERPWDVPTLPHVSPLPTEPIGPLSSFRADWQLEGDYKRQLDEKQKRLRKLQNELYVRKIPMVLAFEGWDAAGKGGAIKRRAAALDPRGYEVFPVSAPTAEEKSYHHLWRFWRDVPKTGHIAIFDRTWYGRVMVERIEGFCTEAQWKRAYEEMNQFEQALLNDGCIVRKFWLQITNDEQLARFQERQSNPEKQWKITDEDWRNRDKWPLYEQAVNDMLQKTNTAQAPWTVVEANDKHFARCKVLDVVIAAIEERLAKDDK